ncbi:hypothetical protein Y1Q_0023062 [Alligator mississippiensis]|uniref:Murine leukemia virus integrase C-terminal domain-containing protein n=1 Tax=Alligator mississippiensis TaxID=8496 RepID=A0A151MRD8_ALLMI|nr:hypothetical protein Y1Q_0023062 [Alligator mississippiensis]
MPRCQTKAFHSQVQATLPNEPDEPCHSILPGDWVHVKVQQQTSLLEPRWKGPFQVLLTTNCNKGSKTPNVDPRFTQ